MSALEKAIDYSKRRGFDEFEIVHIKKDITTVRITDSEIFEIKNNNDEDFGARIIHEKKIFALQTGSLEDLLKTIKNPFTALSHLKERDFWKSLPYEINSKPAIQGTYDEKLDKMSGSKASDIAQEMINSALGNKIDSISGSLNIVSEKFEIMNSNGLYGNDNGTYIGGIINADSNFGDSEVSGFGQFCCRTLDKFQPEKIGKEAKTMCIESINPIKCESGEYTVIFEPYLST